MSSPARPPLCAEVSRADDEQLAATASRVDRWLLVEYRGQWAHDALDGSTLSPRVKDHLRGLVAATPRSRLLLVRRRERAGGVRVVACASSEAGSWARGLTLESHEQLLEVDLDLQPGEPLADPLVLVCTHGKHDPCCAKFGRPLYDALREGVEAWQCTHVGGDRFAGNVVVLPQGLYFGRVEPAEALADEALAGRVRLDRYRGRCCYSFPVQAAERAVRETTGLVGVEDLRLLGTRRTSEVWRVRFGAGDETWEVEVVPRQGPLTHLTCKSRELTHPRHYAAGSPPVRVA